MIRINLLPTRDAPRRQAAVVQIVVMVILLVMAVAVVLTIDAWQRNLVEAQNRTNRVVQSRIDRIQRQIQDHDQIRSRIEEIEGKQQVIDELQAGRTGPVMVMIELAKVLSRNGSPTIDHDRYMDLIRRSPGLAYDPNWDGRRLWLSRFREESREVELGGTALSHEDVAELHRRLTLSDYFYDVILVETRTARESGGPYAPRLVSFEIRCRLRYSGQPPAETAPAETSATEA